MFAVHATGITYQFLVSKDPIGDQGVRFAGYFAVVYGKPAGISSKIVNDRVIDHHGRFIRSRYAVSIDMTLHIGRVAVPPEKIIPGDEHSLIEIAILVDTDVDVHRAVNKPGVSPP